jgi:hypothetical protein
VTELKEMVKVVAGMDERWKCPFEHEPVTHNKTNCLPPPTTENNASTLSSNLDTESKHVYNITMNVKVGGKNKTEIAQFTAHHIIPGNETWPPSKNQLYKWVDDRKGHIIADIGYDVNGARNGVDLPGHTAASSWSNQKFQSAYAFAAMAADTKKRQFHDRHPAYSNFVVNVCNKIAAKLDGLTPSKGCGKKNCAGDRVTNGKYDPPYKLMTRIHGVALRLEKKVTGDSRRWKKPVMTSRFALMFTAKYLNQIQARKQLEVDKFDYT